MVHLQRGFVMNRSGNQPGQSFEDHLPVLVIVLARLIRGAGAWSEDCALTPRRAAGGAAGA